MTIRILSKKADYQPTSNSSFHFGKRKTKRKKKKKRQMNRKVWKYISQSVISGSLWEVRF